MLTSYAMQPPPMRNSAVKLATALFLILLAALSACQQGEGEVCQVDVDCEDGLECNAGTRRCQKPGTGGGTPDADVTPVFDAAVPDAVVPDAMPADAMPADAMPADAVPV